VRALDPRRLNSPAASATVPLPGVRLTVDRHSPPDEVIGREEELASIGRFLDARERLPAIFLLQGEAGIGKTTLWREGLRAAEQRGFRVLSSRPSPSETRLAFTGVADLIGPHVDEILPTLPAPQRRALERALLLAEAEGPPPDPRTIAVALLSSLRTLVREEPLLVALDDVQWLDEASAAALAFALRRLEEGPVAFVLAQRVDGSGRLPLGLERHPEGRLQRIEIGPLSLGALQRLLSGRSGETLSRPVLRRLHELVGGNPFFALEVAHALQRRGGRIEPGEPLPVPPSIDELLGERVGVLPAETVEALECAAAMADPTVDLLTVVLDDRDVRVRLEPAITAQVVDLERGRVRFTHPMLATATYARLSPDRRRDLHRRLGAVAPTLEERARHLALATNVPDEAVAVALDEAARSAAARGAPAAAAELSELAALRTPADRIDEGRLRRIAAAEYHFTAAAVVRAHALLTELGQEIPAGPLRARVWLRLLLLQQDWVRAGELAEQALEEAEGDPAFVAAAEYWGSFVWLLRGNISRARDGARAAVNAAEPAGDPISLVQSVSFALLCDAFGGAPAAPELVERALTLERGMPDVPIHYPPSLTVGLVLMYAGRLDEARQRMEAARQRTLELGDDYMLGGVLLHLAELEVRAGNWATASELAEAGHEITIEMGLRQQQSALLYAKALIAAHQGRTEEARAAATEGSRVAVAGFLFDQLNRAVLGFLELSLGNLAEADRELRPLPAELASMGFSEPSISVAPPNAVEVLVELGEIAEAGRLVDEMERQAIALDSAWTLAQAWRGRGLIAAAEGDIDASLAAFERSLAVHDQVPSPFERARTLFDRGRVQRRARQRRAARESLVAAQEVFEELGARLWVEKARAELARIGGRAVAGGLTPTEGRVAELVAEGLSNKEVAGQLFVTVKTVERHLSRVYEKLGVRSRTELARRVVTEAKAER
jgi:ATP/maltotriose-dependent transcriptional regulator MalT